MKQVDLVLGKEYYCDASNRWQKDSFSSIRYILRDSRMKWKRIRGWYSHGERMHTETLENGTKVELNGNILSASNERGILLEAVNCPYEKFVVFPLSAIRGEYDAIIQVLKEQHRIQAKNEADGNKVYAKNRNDVEASKAVLVKMGLPEAYSLYPVGHGSYDVKVEMSRIQLEWIVSQIQALSRALDAAQSRTGAGSAKGE